MQIEYAIDAGSENMRMCTRTRPDLYRASSLTAIRAGKDAPFAWGDRALEIYGREPENVRISRPVEGGLPVHPTLLALWVKHLMDNADKRGLHKRSVLMAVSSFTRPDMVSAVEKKLLETETDEVCLVPSDVVCALGAGLNALEAKGNLIVNLGAGQITASLISSGRVIRKGCLPFGMSKIDEGIQRVVREELGCAVGPHTARELKNELCAAAGGSDDVVSVKPAFDYRSSLPRNVEISSALLKSCVDEVVNPAIEMISRVVRFAPEELCADLTERGIVLAGGGALLFGFDLKMQAALELPVSVADDPSECAMRGLYSLMDKPDLCQFLALNDTEAERRK